MSTLIAHWPWWLSAVGLAAVPLLMWGVEGRLLGISGSVGRIANLFDRERRRAEHATGSKRDLSDALLKATLAAFGEEELEALETEVRASESQAEQTPAPGKLAWTVHLAFLIMLAVGGFLAAAISNGWSLHFDLGETHAALLGRGWGTLVVLVFGGVLIGFGTRMAGGCTTGHGLTGCSRFQLGSLVATATFFGTAVVVSFLLSGKLLG